MLYKIDNLKILICEIGKKMYLNQYISSTDGNISIRLEEDKFLCTPSNTCKGELIPEQILLTNNKCEVLEGKGTVSSEFYTHLSAYEERPDITSVVHAHPIFATVLSLLNISLCTPILPELVMTLGEVPTTDYATPGSIEGSTIIKPWIKNHNALLLKSHGVLTVGKDLNQAYSYLERVEHSAKILYYAYLLGKPNVLTEEQYVKLSIKTHTAGQ
ncbi:MAG TPA: class II aldolase/adducin family protein [Candidatus Hydrogenedens sp.]|nr:class II aldolase/adducin family protein [Candidatus Hydrogenedens sp.]HOL20481.1 class II aldolase/adducin family protein [Candidatus Hydrogenedens sp.]